MRLIDADRLKEIFSRNVVGGNAYFDLIDAQPTVEAIPKDQYEARLKADMVAMLTDMKDELKHCEITGLWKANYREGFNDGVSKSLDAIQQKINELKAESEDKE